MRILATDLDKTLIPNGKAPYDDSLPVLFDMLADKQIELVYASGRSLPSMLGVIEEYRLKVPKYIVSQVGSRIHYQSDNGWEHLEEWYSRIRTMNQVWDAGTMIQLLAPIHPLELQETHEQNEFKVSYYIHDIDAVSSTLDSIKHILEAQRINHYISLLEDKDNNVVYLDILPERVNKLEAIKFLHEHFQFGDVVYAGDSGNDLDVLTSDLKSILVKNATDVMKQKVKECGKHCYICSGTDTLNGNYSSGIIEGLKHYQWID